MAEGGEWDLLGAINLSGVTSDQVPQITLPGVTSAPLSWYQSQKATAAWWKLGEKLDEETGLGAYLGCPVGSNRLRND